MQLTVTNMFNGVDYSSAVDLLNVHPVQQTTAIVAEALQIPEIGSMMCADTPEV